MLNVYYFSYSEIYVLTIKGYRFDILFFLYSSIKHAMQDLSDIYTSIHCNIESSENDDVVSGGAFRKQN